MEEMTIKNPEMISQNDVARKRAQRGKIVRNVLYYVFGAILAVAFLFPLVYMLATSTKSEDSYVSHAGSLMMFMPDFKNLDSALDNYIKVFAEYGIWSYAFNSLIYAAVVIALNIVINGLAGYAISKFDFPGKGFVTFMIMFLIVVPVETSIIPLYSIVKTILNLRGEISVLAVILPASISIFNIFLFNKSSKMLFRLSVDISV